MQASRDLGLVFEYKSRNKELRETPPNLIVTVPTFVAYDITNDNLNELFGSLTMESDRKTLEQDVKSMSPKAKDVEKDELEERKSQIKKKKVYIKYMVYLKRVFLNVFYHDRYRTSINMIFLTCLLPSQKLADRL